MVREVTQLINDSSPAHCIITVLLPMNMQGSIYHYHISELSEGRDMFNLVLTENCGVYVYRTRAF